jgi:hypothetical protein
MSNERSVAFALEGSLACLALIQHVPRYIQRLLVVDPQWEQMSHLLQQQAPRQVQGARRLELLDESESSLMDDAAAPCDAILLSATPQLCASLPRIAGQLCAALTENGALLILLPNTQYWKHGEELSPDANLTFEGMNAQWAAHHFQCYTHWSEMDHDFLEAKPDENGRITLNESNFKVTSQEEHSRLACKAWLMMFTHEDYQPVIHAQTFFEKRRPDLSYEILSLIRDEYFADIENRVLVTSEKLLSLLSWMKTDANADTLDLCSKAQYHFHHLGQHQSTAHGAFQCMAEFWRTLGDVSMARRLLCSIEHVAPDTGVAAQLASLEIAGAGSDIEITAPPWSPAGFKPRILFVTHPRPHYGLDVLYDGLCTLLGDDSVVDFPFKPFLHGASSEMYANYPCSFDRKGTVSSMEEIEAALQAGEFDLVLYGDTEGALPRDSAQRLARSAAGRPFFLVDPVDEFTNCRPAMEAWLERPFQAYFKREMLACGDYGPNTFPLPFAFADHRVPVDTASERTEDLFWAGHRSFWLRRLYLEKLEHMLDRPLDRHYTPDEYVRALLQSRIGLSFFGFGFDTVRYWEVPAHGAMLLSERLPISIPHDFQDGKTAVFFEDLPELEEKLPYYLAHPEETEAIAVAGHAHFMEHHTGSARARQLLGWIQALVST